ncbi:FGGY-family carbohydrate kinase [Arvimicrobium flavum]|uniref:FGGY-family carbohydrate kinase n=1 Tax=Arvimicrobium flavum TaxID=3393320 RepID=UPI00237B688F|nr:FGGY-family carbohydrate kinase [Mesorhizobium shangrilense]
MQQVVCAVDVGTGSARAGIFTAEGVLLGRADRPIALRRGAPGQAEHDSEDIWEAVCAAVKAAREEAGVAPEAVRGISFDATCSLVVRARDGSQVPVSRDGGSRWDTIAWFDHRALAEADECTATGHPVLAKAGGVMSPEMQTPKLMWLKRRLPESWSAAGPILDLADFLTWRASGSNARSQGTLACKWGYLPDEKEPWPYAFLNAVGLSDMLVRAGLPAVATAIGSDLGALSPEAAAALGLSPACRVGAGLVDAYAGALGALGALPAERLASEAALIAGTSSCVMFASDAPLHLPSVWGPFRDAALQRRWMSEAGQSATGALLDHVILLHGEKPGLAMHERIAGRIGELRSIEGRDFAARLHVLPDFHGNRAPLGDPHALGVVSGLALDASFDGLCRLYWRSCVAIALGVRHIVETLRAGGRPIDTLHVAGGHLRNPLLMELYADATGCRIVEPGSEDAVLLGTAMAAATAAGLHENLAGAASAMGRTGHPRPAIRGADYDRDYRIFLEMLRQRKELDDLSRALA